MERDFAILFADIVDSTRLYETLGNARAMDLTRGLMQSMRTAVDRFGGQVVKSLGDGLLCTFTGTAAAANASMAMLACQDPPQLRIRVGLHFGSVIETFEDKRDILGDAVNVAARVESLARPGEILATEDFVGRLSADCEVRTKLLDKTVVKGKTTPIGIYQLVSASLIDDSFETTVVGISLLDQIKENLASLHLSYQGQTLVMSKDFPKITIGREEACHLRIHSKQASRQHGTIEYVRETFILTDHSSNGTFLVTGGSYPVILRRDSTKLLGAGLIGVGAAPEAEGQEHVIRFRSQTG